MSESTRTSAAWWATDRRNQRATAIGAFALVSGLVAAGVAVWVSPSTNPVNQVSELVESIAGPTKEDQLRDRIARLVDSLDDRNSSVSAANAEVETMKAELAALQQEYWSLEGTLESVRASKSKDGGSSGDSWRPSSNGPSGSSGSGTPTPAAPISAPSKAEIVTPSSPYFGMYTQQAPFNFATLDATARKVGADPGMVGYFGGWDEPFRADAVQRAWQRGMLPMLTWESRPISAGNDEVDAPEYSLPRILDGAFDAYITTYAQSIVANGLPMAIRLNHEMNGVWYPWSETTGSGDSINGNNPGDYVKVWQRVHDIFQAQGANDLVAWVWSPNRVDNLPKSNQGIEFTASLYPGDAYVDWVGMSGYQRNSSGEIGFEQTFGRTLEQLRQITGKPIMLAEIGATENGGQKAAWVKSLFEGLARPENADIVGFGWFSLAVTTYIEGERGTHDWRIDSRADTTTAFAEGLVRPGSRFVIRTPR